MNSSPYAQLDGRTRVLLAIVLTASCGTLHAAAWRALAVHGVVAAACVLATAPRVGWLSGRLAAAGAVSVILATFRWLGSGRVGGSLAAEMAVRIFVTFALMLPLAATMTLSSLTRALGGLRLPAAFVAMIGATARGVTLLQSEAERVALARALRAPNASVGVRVATYGTYAQRVVQGGLQRAQRSSVALELRGADLRVASGVASRWPLRDAPWIAAVVCIAIGSRWLP